MYRNYRPIIFAVISLISLAISINKCQQRKRVMEYWGPELDRRVYDLFYSQADRLTTDEEEKKQYADCCLSKTKELFPNGIADFETQMKNDSIKTALMKMGADCVGDLKSHAGDMAQQLKLQFYSFAETKLLPPPAKTEYVECIAEQLTKAYPYGLSGAQKDSLRKVINKGREHCLKSILSKYKILKHTRIKLEENIKG